VGRILALDVGDKRIGIAISDKLGITARGLPTLFRTNIKDDTRKILEIIGENGCSCVVVGLPLNLSGDDSVQTGKVRAFAHKLENKLASNAMGDVRVELYDERYTTVAAEQSMAEVGMSRARIREAKARGDVDRQAAVVMLMEWLSANGAGDGSGNGVSRIDGN